VFQFFSFLRQSSLTSCRVHLFAQQAFDARLELAILGGVDERVDAAVDEHQHHNELVKGGAIDSVTEHSDKIVDLKG